MDQGDYEALFMASIQVVQSFDKTLHKKQDKYDVAREAGHGFRFQGVASPRRTPSMRTSAVSIKKGAISMITL